MIIAFLPLLMTALLVQNWFAESYPTENGVRVVLSTWSSRVGLLGVFLGLLAATHGCGWLFYRRALPRGRRGRAYAIGCYAAAPLALFTIPPAIWAIGITWYTPAPAGLVTPAFTIWRLFVAPFLVLPLSAFIVGAAVYSTMVMIRVAADAGFVRLTITAALLPVARTVAVAAGPIFTELLLSFGVLLVRSFS